MTTGGIKYSKLFAVAGGFTCNIRICRCATNGTDFLTVHIRFDSNKHNWLFNTDYTMHLLSSTKGVFGASKTRSNINCTASSGYRGIPKFISWDDLTNPSYGFINEKDEITVEIDIYPRIISPG